MLPQSIKNLLLEDSIKSKQFLLNIRKYNYVLSFSSIGTKIDEKLANNYRRVYTFRILGAVYHATVSLLPIYGCLLSFAQIYFHDSFEEQIHRRKELLPNIDTDILTLLQFILQNMSLFKQSLQ